MKRFLGLFCSYVCAFSAPIELCASFECDDCYSIRVSNVDSLEKKQWLLKDSVECECGMWLPPSFKIKNFPGESLSGTGGGCVSIGENGGKMKMPMEYAFQQQIDKESSK